MTRADTPARTSPPQTPQGGGTHVALAAGNRQTWIGRPPGTTTPSTSTHLNEIRTIVPDGGHDE